MMQQEDTIAAISTAPGTGGIGIVRISGENAVAIADRLFYNPAGMKLENVPSHTINYGWIINPQNNEKVDEVLVSVMRKPRTYTREDVVEINCHGGIVQTRRVLELVLKSGARLAEPGEFTKRAFLNGRLDLFQAEAVIDLICAKTERSASAAVHSLEGKISKEMKAVRKRLVEMIAALEVSIDYPEEDVEEVTRGEIMVQAEEVSARLQKILSRSRDGRILREGIKVAIAGKPNVGKSSLLNELAGENRAIVTEIAGTTRDILEEYISIDGIPVCLMDTAGIRETTDVVERIGVEKAKKALESADLVLFVVDAGRPWSEEDTSILNELLGKNILVVVNKIDLDKKIDISYIKEKVPGENLIEISLVSSIGLDELKKRIVSMVMGGKVQAGDEEVIINLRQITLLEEALECVENAIRAAREELPIDFVSLDLQEAAQKLGEITGESVKEDVLEEIFSRFCIGK